VGPAVRPRSPRRDLRSCPPPCLAAGALRPGACLRCVWSKDRSGDLPDMFPRMPDSNALHRPGKVFGHQPPDPGSPIPQDHELVRPLQPRDDSQGIEQLTKVFRFPATSHRVLWPCLIHKHASCPPRAFWPVCGLKDCANFDFARHIPFAFAPSRPTYTQRVKVSWFCLAEPGKDHAGAALEENP
jgi:hypothetical protein